MFAVFSVVSSISGSVKYSDATHLPFSDPERKQANIRNPEDGKRLFSVSADEKTVIMGGSCLENLFFLLSHS